MVTAGAWWCARTCCSRSWVALTVVAVVGLAGALRRLSSLGQYEAKGARVLDDVAARVHVLAAGLGFSAVAISLLVAHAFYKALLFLTSGNVMHGLHDEIDVRRLGGLRRDMPWTAALFGAAPSPCRACRPSAASSRRTRSSSSRATPATSGRTCSARSGRSSRPGTSRGSTTAFMGGQRYEGHAHEASPMGAARRARGRRAVRRRLARVHPEGRLATFLEPVVGRRRRARGAVDASADRDLDRADPGGHRDRLAALPAEERRALDLVPRSRTRHGRGARSRLLHRRPLCLGRGHRGTARGGGARVVRPHGGRRRRERRRAARRRAAGLAPIWQSGKVPATPCRSWPGARRCSCTRR